MPLHTDCMHDAVTIESGSMIVMDGIQLSKLASALRRHAAL